MGALIVTGSAGLIGSEAVRSFHGEGWDVWGMDNDMRRVFFGPEASTVPMRDRLVRDLPGYRHLEADIRDRDAVENIFRQLGRNLRLVIHTAAQPSHDWAAQDPFTDFSINAGGTLNLLQAVRKYCPQCVFIFTSTNKVYGDCPNSLPLVELDSRYEIPEGHPWYEGVTEDMSIDRSTHSLFGVSKTAADMLVQEYGRYFGIPTVTFRCGCLTGPGHAGTELHGFLAYLMKCAATGRNYRIFGYKGKQVRDNIHSADLISAFHSAAASPLPGSVYNMGGGRKVNCSLLEAIRACERITGRPVSFTYEEKSRRGDHIWWISSLAAFREDYPGWEIKYDLSAILEEIFEFNNEQWQKESLGDYGHECHA